MSYLIYAIVVLLDLEFLIGQVEVFGMILAELTVIVRKCLDVIQQK